MNTIVNLVRKNYAVVVLLSILTVHSLALSKLVFFPYPEVFIYPYLTNHGLIPYREIFDQHFPGLFFLPINFGTLGLTTPETARIWLISSVVITQIMIFLIVKKISRDNKAALVANLIYLIWQPFLGGWIFWIDSLMPIILLPVFFLFYQILKKTDKYTLVFLTGLLMSLAVLIKQTALPIAIVMPIILLWYNKKINTLYFYALGFLPVLILVATYFYYLGALKDLWFWTVVFNLTTYAKEGRIGPTFSQLIRVIGIYSPVVLLLLVKDKKLGVALLVFFMGALIGVSDRFDFIHFQPSLPFVAIITSLVLFKILQKRAALILPLIYFTIAAIWLGFFYKGYLSSRVFFYDDKTLKVAEKIKKYSIPGEEIYLFGDVPSLYFMSDTIPAGRVFTFQFPWFLKETQGKFLKSLKEHPPRLIVEDNQVVIDNDPITHFADNLNVYIREHYQVFDRVGSTEFLKKAD